MLLEKKEEMDATLIFMRFLAVVLIVNSHLGELYPAPFMSFGGHIGNTIFYFISGFGLSISYSRSKTSTVFWFLKRVSKIFVPVILYLFVLNLGNWEQFIHTVFNNLIWHDFNQLTYFLPVLLFLYVMFIPLQKINNYLILIILLFFLSAVILFFKVRYVENVMCNIPSSGILFSLNALISFCIGVFFGKKKYCLSWEKKNLIFPFLALAGIVFSQVFHQYFCIIGGWPIALNFYLNFITLLSIYMFFTTSCLHVNKFVFSLLNLVASSSLAIYIVHFRWIYFVKITGIHFPYNIICVYLYSVIFAYPLIVISSFIVNFILNKFYVVEK